VTTWVELEDVTAPPVMEVKERVSVSFPSMRLSSFRVMVKYFSVSPGLNTSGNAGTTTSASGPVRLTVEAGTLAAIVTVTFDVGGLLSITATLAVPALSEMDRAPLLKVTEGSARAPPRHWSERWRSRQRPPKSGYSMPVRRCPPPTPTGWRTNPRHWPRRSLAQSPAAV